MRMICRMVHSPKSYDIWFLLLLLIVACHHIIFGYQIHTEADVAEVRAVKLGKENGLKSSPPLENLQSTYAIVEHYLLIASHDAIYNISLSDLSVFATIAWPSKEFDKMLCQAAYDEKRCINVIKVILEIPNSETKEFLVCGTNSNTPMCRKLVPIQDGEGYSLTNETDGRAIVPGDPDFESTSVYYGNRLFSGSEFKNEPLIFSSQIRTASQSPHALKEPVFVKSLIHQDIVYFFFREVAVDHNCDTAIFSRVARLCPNDKGGKLLLRQFFTSFFKARLTCSIQGKFRFHFDEMYSMTEIGQGNAHPSSDNASIFYAVFNTPKYGLPGSAVCAFKMSDVVEAFKGGYKEKIGDVWTTAKNVPKPNPASICFNDTFALNDATLDFISNHPFMANVVTQFGKNPIYSQSSFTHALTSLAVDWQKKVNDTNLYDIIFIGTDTGRILKVFNLGTTPEVYPELVEVLIMPSNQPIIGLKIFIDPMVDQKKLLIITKDQIFSAPLHRCSLVSDCRSCVSLKDPYCRWGDNGCADSDGLQNLKTGKSPHCPDDGAILSYFEFNRIVLTLFITVCLSLSV